MDAQEQQESVADEPGSEADATPSAPLAEDVAGDAFSDDPTYRTAVVDLLGALAYGSLTAFSRLAADAEMAPNSPAKAALARVAVAEFLHYESLAGRLTEMGADPDVAMDPFIAPIDDFHDRTKPTGWLEGLVKAYVGDGIATDFYREISASKPTRRWPDVSRCGLAAWSVRPCPSLSAWLRNAMPWQVCWWAGSTARAPTSQRWGGCSHASRTSISAGWGSLG